MTGVAREGTAGHAIVAAASYGAAVWATYGIVETAAVVSGPLLKVVLPTAISRLFPSLTSPFNSPALTAVVLALYRIVGAAAGVAVAMPLVFTRVGRQVLSGADKASLWSAVGSLTLFIAFCLNALVAQQPLVVPAVLAGMALGTLRLSTGWRVDWRNHWQRWSSLTSPSTIVLILVGCAFIVQPRRYLLPLVPVISGIGYVAVVLLFAALLPRVWLLSHLRPRIQFLLPHPAVSIALLSCAALTSTDLADASLAVLWQPQPRQEAGDRRPNVILITLDTVRADHLSVYGYGPDTTPHLRRLVATGATAYARSISTSNWTLPSHASMFTGRSAARAGAHDSSRDAASIRPISAQFVTLPELLSQQGYRTAAIVAKTGALAPTLGFARGFGPFDGVELHDFFTPTGRLYLFRESVRRLAAAVFRPGRRDASNAPASMINQRAVRFIESGPQPFFLFLNYLDAHVPYAPPPPFDNRYAGSDPRFRWADYYAIVGAVSMRHTRPIDGWEAAHLISKYDGAIA